MLYSEVGFHQSDNILFNPTTDILSVSLIIVQYNTILSKKVQNYLEVMINYIIAVTLHARRNNLISLVQLLANFHCHG
jgi:hypothetical protein